MATSTYNGFRRARSFIEDAFFFGVLTLLTLPFIGGGIVKDQLQKTYRGDRPGWVVFAIGVFLLILTASTIVCCLLGFILGVIPWGIGLWLLLVYLGLGVYAVLAD